MGESGEKVEFQEGKKNETTPNSSCSPWRVKRRRKSCGKDRKTPEIAKKKKKKLLLKCMSINEKHQLKI